MRRRLKSTSTFVAPMTGRAQGVANFRRPHLVPNHRFRSRIMFRFTIRDVLWLTAVGISVFSCSRGDTAASKKERMIRQLREATEISVVAFPDNGKKCEFQLKAEDKARLIAWLQRAVWDDNPKKYEVLAEIA